MKKQRISILGALGLFGSLIVFSAQARAGAEAGLRLWAELLVPSLLPYFAAAGLLTRLGVVEAAGRRLVPVGKKLLGVDAAGCGIFLLGLSGGYPLGAAAVADAFRSGQLRREEAEDLLGFCDNTGPAFAVGALGLGVFRSAAIGLTLWGVHALCALLLGICRRRGVRRNGVSQRKAPLLSFSEALTGSLSAAVTALLSIGGYVVFFSALLAVGEAFGFPDAPAARCAEAVGLPPEFFRAMLIGSLELSSGVGAMAVLPRNAAALVLAAFLLSWGGLCVHFQAAAVTAGTGLRLGRRLRGKLLHGLLSALAVWFLSPCLL